MLTTDTKPRHIDLTVPTGWNQCTTRQLEQIAQIILRRTAMQDRYHPYDPLQMKTEAFLALAGLEVSEELRVKSEELSDTVGTDPAVSVKDDTGGLSPAVSLAQQSETAGEASFLVRFRDPRPWYRRPPFSMLLYHSNRSANGRLLPTGHSNRPSPAPFPLAVWQLRSFIDQHLKWLDDFTSLWIFPYERFGRDWGRWRLHWLRPRWLLGLPLPCLAPVALRGPAPLFDGFTWQQYHSAQGWLSDYTDVSNQIQQLTADGTPAALAEARSLMPRQQKDAEGFLRALFDCTDLNYTPRRLRRMRPDQLQLCLIWWQSMMAEMQRKYSRCFKSNATSGTATRQHNLPIDLYSRSMATLQDKYHLSEAELLRQPCRVILQHLEDLAHEAEELERINRRSKSKH